MSDASSHAYKEAEIDNTVKRPFIRKVIEYLLEPSSEKKLELEEKAEAFAKAIGASNVERITQLFERLENNDSEEWKKFSDYCERAVFGFKDPDLKALFMKAAEQRNIGSMVRVI
ncbi:MAG TPA: hypothetical protein VGE18_01080 [Candidatus Paceibacterota bacterium]